MSTTSRLLMRLLSEPDFVPAVRALTPDTLGALVSAVGVEDSAELLAVATAEQFVHLVDTSLWKRAGAEGRLESFEHFDHRRFVTWLEVMFEGGEDLVIERLAALPEETVVLAFSGQLIVLDVETLGIGMAGASRHEAELVEKALDACLYLTLADYTLVARNSLGWDAVIAALTAIDQADHEWASRILADCCRASTELVDDCGGLYEVLSADQMLAEDALGERDDRRARRGYVSVADATAFLRLARAGREGGDREGGNRERGNREGGNREGGTERLCDGGELPPRDAITRAYFRNLEVSPLAAAAEPSTLMPLLEEYGIAPSAVRALPAASSTLLSGALASLDEERRATRRAELAYLANVLVTAGEGLGPVEAAQQALEICTAGLRSMTQGGVSAAAVVRETGCDQLFRLGSSL